ncbi:MAG: hypothetical protein PHC38_01085 [Weeksellaceae bacterium]|nr:hypothetical protein [Weeksellaceae bacterium]
MRINNKRINIYIETLYNILLLLFVGSLILIFIPITPIVNLISPYALLLIIGIMIYFLYLTGNQNIEYNSDGEALTIRTQDPFISKYFPKNKTLTDFPKNKVIDYEIKQKFILRKLYLYLQSKRAKKGYVKLSFPITYLNDKELRDLKKSLNRIIEKNNKEKLNERM